MRNIRHITRQLSQQLSNFRVMLPHILLTRPNPLNKVLQNIKHISGQHITIRNMFNILQTRRTHSHNRSTTQVTTRRVPSARQHTCNSTRHRSSTRHLTRQIMDRAPRFNINFSSNLLVNRQRVIIVSTIHVKAIPAIIWPYRTWPH